MESTRYRVLHCIRRECTAVLQYEVAMAVHTVTSAVSHGCTQDGSTVSVGATQPCLIHPLREMSAVRGPYYEAVCLYTVDLSSGVPVCICVFFFFFFWSQTNTTTALPTTRSLSRLADARAGGRTDGRLLARGLTGCFCTSNRTARGLLQAACEMRGTGGCCERE